MTFRTREEHLAASEEFAPFNQPGSFLFSQPSEVTHWCQSVPLQEGFPPTPPDTASDCSASEYSDMSMPSWNTGSLPGDKWTTVPAQDNSTSTQPSASSWHQGTPVTAQELHAMDAASWMNVPQGPVDLGLSPVLSHESQSSRTLNSFSEPDVPFLPPGLDLSFIGEPTWQTPGHVAYPVSHCAPQDYPSSSGASPQHMPYGMPTGQTVYSSQDNVACGPQQQMVYYPYGPHPRIADHTTVHGRPLLPRTDGHSLQGVPSNAGYYALQPKTPGVGNAEPKGRVSSAPGMPREPMSSRPGSIQSVRYMESKSHAGLVSPVGQIPTPRSDSAPVGMPSLIADPANEDFSSFIQYDQEDKAPAPAMSYIHGYGPSVQSVVESRPAIATPEQDVTVRNLATSSTGHSETDEGRYRNHPLYSEGPHADGLYHCPFKSDPSCQHKATKLKCNYDKFIDSHLKPFRCKIEACSKQEFSSTACLLRHEREAHGMHGHGDRPHLCFYPGCERGVSGNGFPRRYNLYDHMKRVHDHKDEASTANQEPSASGSQTQRKSGSRKRRSSSASDERPAQRVKVQPAPREPVPMMAMPPVGPAPEMSQYQEAQNQRDNFSRQRVLYSQWAQQRELLNYQMSSVQGPDDEVNLQRLSQNIEELRRLSQQARQG